MTTPKIKPIAFEDLAAVNIQTAAFVFLNVPAQTIETRFTDSTTKPFGLSMTLSSKFPEAEDPDRNTACTLEDVLCLLDLLAAIKEEETLYIVEKGSHSYSSVGFLLYTAAEIYFKTKITDALYQAAVHYPYAKPDALWVAMCIDKGLNLQLELVDAYNDYYATGTLVNSKGNLLERSFA